MEDEQNDVEQEPDKAEDDGNEEEEEDEAGDDQEDEEVTQAGFREKRPLKKM